MFSIFFSVKVFFFSMISRLLKTGLENVRARFFFYFDKIVKVFFFFCQHKLSDLACLKCVIICPMIK